MGGEVMDMLINLIVVNISLHTHINTLVVQFKSVQFLLVKYSSIRLQRKKKKKVKLIEVIN
jgi:hypothetical protein